MCRRTNDAPKDLRVKCYQGFGRPIVAVSTHTHVCCRIRQFKTAPFKGYKGFADQVLLRAYTCVLQKSGLHQEVEMLSGLRCEHRHTHTHVRHTHTRALRTRSLEGCTQEPRVQGFGRPLAAASTHMCVEQNKSIQGCTQRSICYKAMADRVLL